MKNNLTTHNSGSGEAWEQEKLYFLALLQKSRMYNKTISCASLLFIRKLLIKNPIHETKLKNIKLGQKVFN